MKKGLAFVIILLGVLTFTSAYDCNIKQNSCDSGYNAFLRLYRPTNSHIAEVGTTNYKYLLCCNFPNASGNGVLIRASSSDNAHAEIPSGTAYSTLISYANLSCIDAPACSSGHPIKVLSLAAKTNSHVGEFDEYPVKICCSYSAPAALPDEPYWADMNGVPISEASSGNMVQMIAPGVNSGTFKIIRKKNGWLGSDKEIRSGIKGRIFDGKFIANWTIMPKDFKDLQSYNNFSFQVGDGNWSEELRVDPNFKDSDFNLKILSPNGGDYFNKSSSVQINISADDKFNKVDGNVYVNNVNVGSFTNGKTTIEHVFDVPGNSTIVANGTDSKNKRAQKFLNIMILDIDDSGRYKDGSYVAASIKSPEDGMSTDNSTVNFDASTTRGIVVTNGKLKLLIPGRDNFSWNWTFFRNGEEISLFNKFFNLSNSSSGFIFTKHFGQGGHYYAALDAGI